MVEIKCSIIDNCIIRASKNNALYFEVLIDNTIVSIYKSDKYERHRLIKFVTYPNKAMSGKSLEYDFNLISNLDSFDCLLKDSIMQVDVKCNLFDKAIRILQVRELI